MKKLTHSTLAKTVAFFLATIIFTVTALMITATVVLINSGDFGNAESVKKSLTRTYLFSNADQLFYTYADDVEKTYGISLEEWAEGKNYYYTIYDEKGEILENNYNGEDYYISCTNRQITEEYNKSGEEWISHEYDVQLRAKKVLTDRDIYAVAMQLVDFCCDRAILFIVFSFVNIVLLIILMVFLCFASGRRHGSSEPLRNAFDKIPFDVYTGLYIALAVFEIFIIDSLPYYQYYFAAACIILMTIADFVFVLAFIMSLSTRIKTGTLFKNTLVFLIISHLWRFLRVTYSYVKKGFVSIPLIPKTAIVLTAVFIYNIILGFASRDLGVFFLIILEMLFLIPSVLYYAYSLRKIQKAGEKIAKGDLEHRVDTQYLIGEIKEFGESLNNIGTGMSKAVNEKIKSERLKTELITNVSHDIKTPLTSIINYVDLIKKEETDNQNIKEYAQVLDRQSGRLKKLIEDLVEASKASTGNISVNPEPCDIGVLLAQTAGEYEERATKNGLEIMLEKTDDTIIIMADGRHLWRVFDNLMNNICKYSLRGTRVYLSLKKFNNKAVVTFRNISRTSLNISSDDLMERFVRGDSSRNTEGSGLGLSIAKSLVELQNGKMVLTVDGDLFKVLLTFDTVN